METIKDIFGQLVFNDDVMKEMLDEETYHKLNRTIASGRSLDLSVANDVACAMKTWAISKGATHFTHWFQPMTGITCEKHDSFINVKDNRVVMDFSGKELIKGEPDASSLPTGGLRATFEARGYTAWDPTSYAFIKGTTLCIPTVFYSYSGEVLDKKTPLLKSNEILNREAKRILRLFGNDDVKRVIPTCGAEQEYFLINKELYNKRKDLVLTGRTLFGARPPKGQELEDHYFGVIKPTVLSYMEDLDKELWRLGVFAKTRHNETAPSQHELAPIFTAVNIATDQNQLIMEIMKKVASDHGLACLLHEKPFGNVNGSGKHNNYSLQTDTGINLFSPGKNPYENKQFLLFLCAMIKVVDLHQDLLRITVASSSNDHRLGGDEAPPAIVSIYLGEVLCNVLKAIANDENYDILDNEKMLTGVKVLPDFKKDNSDRNRTSPFAFTGNKFEFRMLGSSSSIAGPNIVLNTGMAQVLREFADELENCGNFEETLNRILKDTIIKHDRILFNGNNYSKEWEAEAKKRGLLNLKTTADALPHYISDKNIKFFGDNHIYNEKELVSRHDIHLDNYCNIIKIEAKCMIDMVNKQILPSVNLYLKDLLDNLGKLSGLNKTNDALNEQVDYISKCYNELYYHTINLQKLISSPIIGDIEKQAFYCKEEIIPMMELVRSVSDKLEVVVSKEYWPFPTYSDLLFSI
ncbi:MAG: glutamine synthetase III [Erysipelotrichaceae bacterium]